MGTAAILKSIRHYGLTAVVLTASSAAMRAAEVYPIHSGRYPVPPAPAFKLADGVLLIGPFESAVGGLIGENTPESDKTAVLARAAVRFEERLTKEAKRNWEVVSPQGRMPLPAVVIHPNRHQLEHALDCSFFVDVLESNQNEQADLFSFGLFWSAWLGRDPGAVFSRLAQQSQDSAMVSSIDVVQMLATAADTHAYNSSRRVSAGDWRALRLSSHPCKTFIALASWHLADLPVSERLQACRDSLFGACSFLEARTLSRMRDPGCHSEAMQALVREYLASSPVPNDHTLPGPDGPWEESRQYTLATAILALPPSTEEEVKASTVATTPPPDDGDENTSTPASRPELMPGLPGGSILAKTKHVQYMQFGFALLVVLLALWYLRKYRAKR